MNGSAGRRGDSRGRWSGFDVLCLRVVFCMSGA